MTKLKKQRKRKVFKYKVNRKRLRNKIASVGNIECKEVKNAWEQRKSVVTNLREMGLSYDPNKTIKIPNTKSEIRASLLSNKDEWEEEQVTVGQINTQKAHVAELLECDAKAPRERNFRLPKSQIEWLTYLMHKYKNNFKAMERDKKNYNQETWKQIRQKIKRFKSIPQQFQKFVDEYGPYDYDLNNVSSDDEI